MFCLLVLEMQSQILEAINRNFKEMALKMRQLEVIFEVSRTTIMKEQAAIRTGLSTVLEILGRTIISEHINDVFPLKKEDDLKVLEIKLTDEAYYGKSFSK